MSDRRIVVLSVEHIMVSKETNEGAGYIGTYADGTHMHTTGRLEWAISQGCDLTMVTHQVTLEPAVDSWWFNQLADSGGVLFTGIRFGDVPEASIPRWHALYMHLGLEVPEAEGKIPSLRGILYAGGITTKGVLVGNHVPVLG